MVVSVHLGLERGVDSGAVLQRGPHGIITSDASGNRGAERFTNRSGSSSNGTPFSDISIKELIPIVIAASIWGHKWAGKTSQACCDMAVVHVLGSRQSRDSDVMHLLRCLALV